MLFWHSEKKEQTQTLSQSSMSPSSTTWRSSPSMTDSSSDWPAYRTSELFIILILQTLYQWFHQSKKHRLLHYSDECDKKEIILQHTVSLQAVYLDLHCKHVNNYPCKISIDSFVRHPSSYQPHILNICTAVTAVIAHTDINPWGWEKMVVGL